LARETESAEFSDVPTGQAVEHPEWFKKSLLDLREDLAEAVRTGKAGLVVYFGQARCPYCRQLLEGSLARSDVEAYARDHFDFVGLDIFSNDEVVTPDGAVLEVGEFAVREQARLTPSLLFYTAGGHQALKLRGYYPPYKLRAALEYVAGGHFAELRFREYLELADPPPRFEPADLTGDPLFSPPPHALDRSVLAAQRPLLVVLEQGECHACDVLHSGPLRDPGVRALLERFDVVQLDLQDDRTPVITPDGIRLSPRAWANQLGVFYAPALFFYDEHGWEVFRLDSVAHLHRLRGALEYVLEKGYLVEPLFQRWRRQH
jgi:thioredoxin-related protein